MYCDDSNCDKNDGWGQYVRTKYVGLATTSSGRILLIYAVMQREQQNCVPTRKNTSLSDSSLAMGWNIVYILDGRSKSVTMYSRKVYNF